MGWKQWATEYEGLVRRAKSLGSNRHSQPNYSSHRITPYEISGPHELQPQAWEGGQPVPASMPGRPRSTELPRQASAAPVLSTLQEDFKTTTQWLAFDAEDRRYSHQEPARAEKRSHGGQHAGPEPLYLTSTEYALLQRNMEEIHSREHMSKGAPLVSDLRSLRDLREEYQNYATYYVVANKVNSLRCMAWRGLRRVRGDGDCFYRALAFVYLSHVLRSRDRELAVGVALSNVERTLEMIVDAKLTRLIEGENSGHQTFQSVLQRMILSQSNQIPIDSRELLRVMQDRDLSNGIVKYFRAITSAEIRLNPKDYEGFFDASDQRLFPEYTCQGQVEACGVEADHPQIHALTNALQLRIQIAELTLESHRPVSFVTMPTGKDNEKWENGIEDLALLFRPGHYDILERQSREGY